MPCTLFKPAAHLFPSTAISPRLRSWLTRSFFALASCAWCSASISSLRFNVSLSASRPASRELTRVGRGVSRLTGSERLLRLGAVVGAGLAGMIFLAVAEMSFRMARFASMFSKRLRSKALISAGSFLVGILMRVEARDRYVLRT